MRTNNQNPSNRSGHQTRSSSIAVIFIFLFFIDSLFDNSLVTDFEFCRAFQNKTLSRGENPCTVPQVSPDWLFKRCRKTRLREKEKKNPVTSMMSQPDKAGSSSYGGRGDS